MIGKTLSCGPRPRSCCHRGRVIVIVIVVGFVVVVFVGFFVSCSSVSILIASSYARCGGGRSLTAMIPSSSSLSYLCAILSAWASIITARSRMPALRAAASSGLPWGSTASATVGPILSRARSTPGNSAVIVGYKT
jgi:hypothetical protein